MDIPETPHYAIVTFQNIHIEGDERSRTHPGHGYPAHTVETADYKAYTTREEWEKAVKSLETRVFGKPSYRAMYVVPAKVLTSTTVNVEVNL